MPFLAPTLITHLAVGAAAFAVARRARDAGLVARLAAPVAVGTTSVAVGILVAQVFGQGFFGAARYAAWGLFVELPLLLAALAATARRRGGRLGWGAAAATIVLVGLEGFVREPAALEVRTHRVPSAQVRAPLRIAVIADLQHDDVGPHEREALRRAADARPDLVLFAGDYAQTWHPEMADLQRRTAALVAETFPTPPPLGAFAVQGNVDYDDWGAGFAGSVVQPVAETTTVQLRDDVTLTLLSMVASFRFETAAPRRGEGLHVVVGHSPNYGVSSGVDADVLLAGHTHGGQIQLPFVGALVTGADVPRTWVDGLTRLPRGGVLVVSRGVGMQRLEAPRMRLFCLPELTIVDVVPAAGQSQAETP